ncbi:IclR family transcriptional regulator [Saccharopolyspora karakumensis]|uniref:Glycerol operon regulatory protein n=1 Tax=Saccharopolyspora karakumensis TaxID=2530386 RepID=A0A4R5BT00_9PSEU|nr:IclR family transcriptional regulator [Saccharopolyspora karakumensis]TDD89195.1 IclR family transcriptional regulator [Saccharopolyspora karakumensis]
MGEPSDPAPLTNKSVVKAARLLRILGRHSGGASASAIAAEAGIPQPTAFRLLATLEQEGLVDRTDNNYLLGWEMARLGRLADPYGGLVSRVQPALDELAAELSETVTLAVPNSRHDFDVIAEAIGPHVVGAAVRNVVGKRFPLHASSTGKILLAELPSDRVRELLPEKLEAFTSRTIVDRTVLLRELEEVREQGYSVLDNELEEELLSLSRPVRDEAGTLAAVLTVDGPRYRFGRDRIPGALQSMEKTAGRITELLWSEPDAST